MPDRPEPGRAPTRTGKVEPTSTEEAETPSPDVAGPDLDERERRQSPERKPAGPGRDRGGRRAADAAASRGGPAAETTTGEAPHTPPPTDPE
jgi:hypothetical protein